MVETRICIRCHTQFTVQINKARKGHYCSLLCYRARTETTPILERFWSKVVIQTTGEVFNGEHCWLWTAATLPYGHGIFGLTGRNSGTTLAHRFSWELVNGPIPIGLDIDHCCHSTACVNVKHLQLVSKQEHGHLGSPNGNRTNMTGYRGVFPNKNRWSAHIQIRKQPIHLGTFNTPLEAAQAYNEACLRYLSPEAARRRMNKL